MKKSTVQVVLFGIYFGEGDPEQNGQHWNFTQSTGEGEIEPVCVVKEIQQLVLYGNIDKLSLSRKQLKCTFNDSALNLTGTKELVVNYKISDKKWSDIYLMAQRVFKNETYFKIL